MFYQIWQKNLKPHKTDTARKPISKGVEWWLFEPHRMFQCRVTAVQPPQRSKVTSMDVYLKLSQQCNTLCSSNKRHSTAFCKSFSLMRSKNFEAIFIKSRDYSLGVLSNLANIQKCSKQIPLESPSQKEYKSACLSLVFQCIQSCFCHFDTHRWHQYQPLRYWQLWLSPLP